MKKIIGALALASLTLGIASADVKFSLNYRTRMAAFSRVMTANTTDAKKALYTSHLFDHYGYGSSTDTFKMSVSNDFAGANFRIDPTMQTAKAEDKDSTTNKIKSIAVDSNTFGGDDLSKLKEYNGYIKIGNLTVSAGLFSDKLNGKYQLKSDADASNLEGESFAAYKLGSIFKSAITRQADDIVSFSGTAALSGVITYAADFGGLKLTADLAAVGLGGATFGTNSSDVMSGFAVRLDAKTDSVDTQFVIKQKQEDQRSMALHIQPVFGNLTLTLGGALGFNKGVLEEYNADIRLYYKAGAFSFTSLNNISALSPDATVASVDYATHVGAAYNTGSDGLSFAKNTASRRAMWNVIGVRFAASEKLALMLQVGDIVGFKSDKGHFSDDFGVEAFVAPGLQLFAGKNCSISTCARIGFSHLFMNSDSVAEGGKGKWGDDRGEMALLIPVVLRVKL